MSYNFGKPKLFSILLAVLVVFVMVTGAFVGAANNSVVNIEPVEGEIKNDTPGLDIAGYTEQSELDDSFVEPEIPINEDDSKFIDEASSQIEPVIPVDELESDSDESGVWYTDENGERIWQPTEVE